MIHSMNSDIYKSDYFYELPEELIAKFPLENRSDSKLLTVTTMTLKLIFFQILRTKLTKKIC